METEYSRLRWQCHRGVKELDIVFDNFLENYYLRVDKKSQQTFRELLELEDPVLLAMLMGNINSDKPSRQLVLEQLRNLFTS